MPITLNPYISFRDNAREALEFYRSVLGGELALTTFAEGDMAESDAENDLIMHGQLVTPLGLVLMAADTPLSMEWQAGTTISVSLSGEDSEDDLLRYWDGLKQGGIVTAPFDRAPWGDRFGMLVDRFGVPWLVNSTAAAAG